MLNRLLQNLLQHHNLWIISILSVLYLWVCLDTAQQEITVQKAVSKQIIRLHVLANSDSPEDQALKLKVKDCVVEEMQRKLKNVTSLADAKSTIVENIPVIEHLATEVIQKEGYSYSVTGTMENAYFPEKTYGDMTFPAGTYQALRLKIGSAEGRNWWCVLFPSLCFVDETYAVVPDESKEKLKKNLKEDEYEALLQDRTEIRIDFSLRKLFR